MRGGRWSSQAGWIKAKVWNALEDDRDLPQARKNFKRFQM
ncbi:unnamed protein product, partial [Allacma fusca]